MSMITETVFISSVGTFQIFINYLVHLYEGPNIVACCRWDLAETLEDEGAAKTIAIRKNVEVVRRSEKVTRVVVIGTQRSDDLTEVVIAKVEAGEREEEVFRPLNSKSV